jgi:hypothetical protein
MESEREGLWVIRWWERGEPNPRYFTEGEDWTKDLGEAGKFSYSAAVSKSSQFLFSNFEIVSVDKVSRFRT